MTLLYLLGEKKFADLAPHFLKKALCKKFCSFFEFIFQSSLPLLHLRLPFWLFCCWTTLKKTTAVSCLCIKLSTVLSAECTGLGWPTIYMIICSSHSYNECAFTCWIWAKLLTVGLLLTLFLNSDSLLACKSPRGSRTRGSHHIFCILTQTWATPFLKLRNWCAWHGQNLRENVTSELCFSPFSLVNLPGLPLLFFLWVQCAKHTKPSMASHYVKQDTREKNSVHRNTSMAAGGRGVWCCYWLAAWFA